MAIRLLVFFAATLLPSCVTIKHPITAPDQSKPDERLFGDWKAVPRDANDTAPLYLFIGKSGHDSAPVGLMKAILVERREGQNLRADTMYFFRATLGGDNYAHIVDNATSSPDGRLQWNKDASTYTLLKYTVGKDSIHIWAIDESAAETAITQGRLKGIVTKRGPSRTVQITETGDGLARFLKGGGGKLLFPDGDKLSFVRIDRGLPSRMLILLAASCILILSAVWFTSRMRSTTLAQRTLRLHGDQMVTFRVTKEQGRVYVSASEKRAAFRQGWSTTSLLGDAVALGGTDTDITPDDTGQHVCIRVGIGQITFHLASKTFSTD